MNPRRRQLLLAGAAMLPGAAMADGTPPPSAASTRRPLAFPRDCGAHPDARIEWWYLTGLLDAAGDAAGARGGPIGMQLTFFRIRTAIAPDNPSRFAAHQLLLAHAAIADPARGALLHDERLAREGFGVAQAAGDDTHVGVDRWRLDRSAAGAYSASVQAAGFAFAFSATPTQPVLLQGEGGYSRKGGGAGSQAASYYYTEPQLRLRATVEVAGRSEQRRGTGWLDHEWSDGLLPAGAVGWDWGGYNLADGSSLTWFRMRGTDGTVLHAYACLRPPGGTAQRFAPAQVDAVALATWQSPRSRIRYPVAQRLRIGARTFETHPLMNDQEYAAGSGGDPVYWEGAGILHEAGRPVGRGYLELTGYGGRAPDATLGR